MHNLWTESWYLSCYLLCDCVRLFIIKDIHENSYKGPSRLEIMFGIYSWGLVFMDPFLASIVCSTFPVALTWNWRLHVCVSVHMHPSQLLRPRLGGFVLIRLSRVYTITLMQWTYWYLRNTCACLHRKPHTCFMLAEHDQYVIGQHESLVPHFNLVHSLHAAWNTCIQDASE